MSDPDADPWRTDCGDTGFPGIPTRADVLRDRRVQYESAGLDVDDLAPEPVDQWRRWHDQALDAGVAEPNAMTVATIGADGVPDPRIVLARAADEGGLVFYTNYEGAKSRQLDTVPTSGGRVRLARPAPPGSGARPRRAACRPRRATRTSPRVPREPARRVGVAAERRDRRPVPARRPCGPVRQPLRRRRGPPPGELGWLAADPLRVGVLAGPAEPAARSAPLPIARRPALLAHRPPRPLTSGHPGDRHARISGLCGRHNDRISRSDCRRIRVWDLVQTLRPQVRIVSAANGLGSVCLLGGGEVTDRRRVGSVRRPCERRVDQPVDEGAGVRRETRTFPVPPHRARTTDAGRQLDLHPAPRRQVHGVVGVESTQVRGDALEIGDDVVGRERPPERATDVRRERSVASSEQERAEQSPLPEPVDRDDDVDVIDEGAQRGDSAGRTSVDARCSRMPSGCTTA